MPRPAPIYRNHEETYQADACSPLVDAVAGGRVRLEALVHGHYPGRKLPAGALPGVKTVGYWDAAQDQDWGLPWHRNEGIELTFLERGVLGFALDGAECKLHPDDLTVTRPWQRHRVGLPAVTAGRLHWLILDVGVRRPNQSWKWPPWVLLAKEDRDELTDILRHNEKPVWRATPDIRRCFGDMAAALQQRTAAAGVSHLSVRINELLLLLLDLFRSQRVRLDRSLSSSLRTVELFLADLRAHPEHLELDWTVEDMARQCGLGVTQFIHHVKRLTNMTPSHFLNGCRLELAARLLRERSGVSVLDVALACGFSSSQYFATVFSRRFGCAPTDWRRRSA